MLMMLMPLLLAMLARCWGYYMFVRDGMGPMHCVCLRVWNLITVLQLPPLVDDRFAITVSNILREN